MVVSGGSAALAAAVAVCALLGTDSGWQRAICGIAFALLLIIWSWRLELLEWGLDIRADHRRLAAGLALGHVAGATGPFRAA